VVEEWSFIKRFLANTLHHFVCFTRTSVSHSHPTPMSLQPILGLCPPLYWGFLSHRHTVGLLWTSDRPVAQASTYTGQHNIKTQGTNIQALSRIRTCDPSNQAAEELSLRPHGLRDRQPPYIHPNSSLDDSHIDSQSVLYWEYFSQFNHHTKLNFLWGLWLQEGEQRISLRS
jgi:hypothetical protein